MNATKQKLTPISLLHFVKLGYRSLLLVLAGVVYALGWPCEPEGFWEAPESKYWLLGVTWMVYVAEMACRFFPSRWESMGCQKQFRRNYQPTGADEPRLTPWTRTLTVALAWILLNGGIGLLYHTGIIDGGVLVLISLAYGVCDMICILFFCPFQAWFLKNRCCTVCRIYNWDFAMMFTPLVFLVNGYTLSLVGMSLLLLLRWEITYRRHPERFSDRTNAAISCAHCEEKLCRHKKQLKRFVGENVDRLRRR